MTTEQPKIDLEEIEEISKLMAVPNDDGLANVVFSGTKTALQIAAALEALPKLVSALEKIIEMNRQQAHDQYRDADKAESWSCVVVAREVLEPFTTKTEQ